MTPVIELKNVTKTMKGFSLKNLNLEVKGGFVTGFIGPNGAGKTTTLKLIMNLIKPDSGEVKLFGLDYAAHEKEIKERIGFVYAGQSANHFLLHPYYYRSGSDRRLYRFYPGWRIGF